MDWMHSNSLNRKRHRKRSPFGCGKSTSEPNLINTSHFTPRFPDNLSHLIHEYVSVDELKFYRKRRPPNIDDEFHSKDSICLYDKNQPIIPFAAIKSEYTKKFGKVYSPRSRSVPNKFDLNATTKELLDALRDDFSDFTPVERRRRAKTAKISGEIEIDGVDDFFESDANRVSKKSDENSNKESSKQQRTFKVQGELSYSPNKNAGEFSGQSTMERSESNPQLSNIKFSGRFHGTPEYNDSYKAYNHFTKSAPIKATDHLRVSPTVVNTAIVTPNLSSLSEYTDQFRELKLNGSAQSKYLKPMSSVTARNNLMIGHSDQHIFPEYFDNFKNPQMKKMPERPKPRSPILQMSGSLDYNPEYRVKFTDFPRQRPIMQKPESYFDFFDRPRKLSPVRQAIIAPKFNPNPHVAIVEPSQIQAQTIDKNPFYLCQPEVRKARREILIKKRPASPRQTIAAAVRSTGRILPKNEDDENRSYNERSRIVKSPIKPPIQVTIDNFDEPLAKPTIMHMDNRMSSVYGRRPSMLMADVNGNLQAKRNASKIIEGNHEYAPKKKTSLTSTTTTDDECGNRGRKIAHSQSLKQPSFVILNDPIRQNKWMKSSWYL